MSVKLEPSYRILQNNIFLIILLSFFQGRIGEALDEFHQAMRSAAEQQEIALICQYEIGEQ